MHTSLLNSAERRLELGTVRNVSSLDEFLKHAQLNSIASESCDVNADAGSRVSPFVLAPWHDDPAAEAKLKAETSFTIRCFPAQVQPVSHGEENEALEGALPFSANSYPPISLAVGSLCFYSQRPATHLALFARSY